MKTTEDMRCDFSKGFEQAFRKAILSMTDEICLCVLHTITLSVALDPDKLVPDSPEWHILHSLREQAKREFEILNRRSNPGSRPVMFTVTFTSYAITPNR